MNEENNELNGITMDEPIAENDISLESTHKESTEEPSTPPDVSDGESIESLKREIDDLRSLLAQKEAEQSRILNELSEFDRLFPEISVKSVPEDVWRNVELGIPLCAAYALYEKEESVKRNRAAEINERNSALSYGRAGKNTVGEYFSPDEVKSMSQKQVHENYSKIKESMKYWR